MNIVVVEDDPIDRKLLMAVLEIGGHVASEQRSAENAYDAIIAAPPDLILLDLKLPGMDGLSLSRRLKQDERTRHIPIVAITAAIEEFSREDVFNAGCNVYLTKPIDTRRLAEQVAAAATQVRPKA